MANHRPHAIGVLGGMGPRAGVACLDAIFKAARDHGARENHEFPRVVLHSIPARSQISRADGHHELVEQLRSEARLLEQSGATVLLLACVTMHEDLAALRASAEGTWISLVDETVSSIAAGHHRAVAILATETTENQRIFAEPLGERGVAIVPLEPAERSRLTRLIESLIGGAIDPQDGAWLNALCLTLKDRGATAVVLACTDLAALPPLEVPGIVVYDALSLGATAAWRTFSAG